MSHDEFRDLVPLYALGALDGEDLARFQDHLAGCDDCRRQLREHERAAAELAASLPPVRPSPELRARVLAAAGAPRPNRVMRIVAGIAAAAAAVLLVAVINLRNDLERAQEDLEFFRTATVSLMKPNEGVPDSKLATGVVWHRDRTLVLTAHNLPKLPEGRVYELWAFFDKKPVRAGEFEMGSDGIVRGRHTMDRDLAQAEGFAISLERAGGVDSPTASAIYLLPR